MVQTFGKLVARTRGGSHITDPEYRRELEKAFELTPELEAKLELLQLGFPLAPAKKK